ncbi:hypothetical protein KQI52_14390 [bacterium]|nr:hypothetical protein [bacterium]
MKKMLVILLGLVFVAGVVVADPVDVAVTCLNTEIPAEGGELCFNVNLHNNLGYGHAGEIWLMVDGPNCTGGPYMLQCFWLYPMGNIIPGCGIQIPAYAVEGDYELQVYVGGYAQNYVAGMGIGCFCKLPAD